jgi:hypothetical protein
MFELRTSSASPKSLPAAVVCQYSSQPVPTPSTVSSATIDSQAACPEMETTKSQVPSCAKPFDRWKPVGGGAEHDIFRRFKILANDEVAFLIHWANKSSGKGIISHDESGTLIFRISSAHISDLAGMHISRSDAPDNKAQWTHAYDQDGISWLKRPTELTSEHSPSRDD